MSVEEKTPFQVIKEALVEKHGPAPVEETPAWALWLIQFEMKKLLDVAQREDTTPQEKDADFEAEIFILNTGLEEWLKKRINERMEKKGVSATQVAAAIRLLDRITVSNDEKDTKH